MTTVVLPPDKLCQECNGLDPHDPETLQEVEACGRTRDLWLIQCRCKPQFSIQWRDLVKPKRKVGKTDSGLYYDTDTGEILEF